MYLNSYLASQYLHVYCLDVDPALVGLSLFYAIRLTGLLQFTIRTSADMENLVRTNKGTLFCLCKQILNVFKVYLLSI